MLYTRGCACGGAVHFHTCLSADERTTCVCDVCRVPFGKDLTEALSSSARSECQTPEDHHQCDIRDISVLGPCLTIKGEANLLARMCIRRLRTEQIDRSLLAMFVHIGRLQGKLMLYDRVAQTKAAIHTIFGELDGYGPDIIRADTHLEAVCHNPA